MTRLSPVLAIQNRAFSRAYAASSVKSVEVATRPPFRQFLCNEGVLGLDPLHRVAAERQPQRRILGIDQRDEGARQLARIAALAVIDVVGMCAGVADALAVIVDVLRGARQRGFVEEVGAEEAGLDHGDLDAERRHFAGQRLADAFDRELGRAVDAPAGISPRSRRPTRR